MDSGSPIGYGVMGSSAEILAEAGQAPPLQPKTPPSPGVGSLQSVNSTTTIATIATADTAAGLLPYKPYADSDLDLALRKERWYWLALQVSVPFLIAGCGTIGAGLVLGKVEKWEVFKYVPDLFILVPSLLGLKGNLDMCLASRLSTQANLGNLRSWRNIWDLVVSNMALVQVQAIIASLLAASFAVAVGYVVNGSSNYKHCLLLAAAAVTTATCSCFVLDFLMIMLIVLSHRVRINPDNVVCPMAASIGDIVSLSIFSQLACFFFEIHDDMWWIFLVVMGAFLMALPLWITLVLRHKHTASVLKSGWVPVLSALFISGLGGIVLGAAVEEYKGFVLFNPIINGIGGNLASVQASRVATMLHQTSILGYIPDITRMCVGPFAALFHGVPSAKSARILIAMSIPGQALFVYAADYINNMESKLTVEFVLCYLTVSLLQVMILLYSTHLIVHFMWKRKLDPDNAAIPYLTALGDLLGTLLLAGAFVFLKWNGTPYAGGSLDIVEIPGLPLIPGIAGVAGVAGT